MPAQPAHLAGGFRDSVHDAQAAFRVVMRAMARPALPVALPSSLAPPAPLLASTAAVLLTLADYETTIWLDAQLGASEAVRQYTSFHTGARLVSDPAEATFAVAAGTGSMPPLATLNLGTPEYPDRSTTLIVQVMEFHGAGLVLQGPGIKGCAEFSFAGMSAAFAGELAANRAQFPCGVDLLFAAPNAVAALPRSVRLATGG